MKKPTPAAARALKRAARMLGRAVETSVSGAAVPSSASALHALAAQLAALANGASASQVFDPPRRGRPSRLKENSQRVLAYWQHRAASEARGLTARERPRAIAAAVEAANAARPDLAPLTRATIERHSRTMREYLRVALEFGGIDASALDAFLRRQTR
jgi:hypothetical protein